MVKNDEAQMAAFITSAAKLMLPFAEVAETDLLEVVKNFIKNRGFWSAILTCSRQSSGG